VTAVLDNDDLQALGRLLKKLSPAEVDPDYRAPQWAKTSEMCKELNISEDYAAAHKRELGACVLPASADGARPMLRWEMDVARAWFASRRIGAGDAPTGSAGLQAPSSKADDGKSAGSRTPGVVAGSLTARPYSVP
jgi:hypothetical protein